MDWISVKDRLPSETEDILICSDNGEVFSGRVSINNGVISRVFTSTGHNTWGGITHWMPLPEPPIDN